jgi:uncharacterized protein with PIN domain
MLGGLARWLRAAGYDADFVYGADDAEVIRRALRTRRLLLSCDGPLFERNLIRQGTVRALLVPRELDKLGQLRFVLEQLRLPVLPMPRCMACGGQLLTLAKDDLAGEVGPRTLAAFDEFWRCSRCRKVFWRGSHWQRIQAKLAKAR